MTAQLEIWYSSEATGHRVEFALVAPLITAPIAVRRHWPTLVGVAVPVLAAAQYASGRDPQILSEPIAIFCALYALAVWTPPHRFADGLTLVIAVDLATSASPWVYSGVVVELTVSFSSCRLVEFESRVGGA